MSKDKNRLDSAKGVERRGTKRVEKVVQKLLRDEKTYPDKPKDKGK